MMATLSHDLVDVIDMYPIPGEYAHCTDRREETVFGVTIMAFHRYHAARTVVSQKWQSKCECCGHGLRYAHITVDHDGIYHCFGRTCLSIQEFGEEATRKLEYAERITQKENGFCATFNVPSKFWDMPREDRPTFARAWKGKAMTRRGNSRGGSQWKLTVWGACFEECLDNCMSLSATLGIKLS